jgi:hypothetical protein
MNEILNSKKEKIMSVVFITGAQWLGEGVFEKFYAPKIKAAFARKDTTFVLGAANGVDMMAQLLLVKLCEQEGDFDRVTIYDKGAKDGRICMRFKLQNGFASYPERDVGLFANSNERIVFLPQYGSAASGVMLTVLLEIFDGDYERASAAHKKIRLLSEPEHDSSSQAMYIKTLYAALYPVEEKKAE